MVKRIVAIVFIFVCASIAWAILGTTIFSRTYDLNQVSVDSVESLWGTAQNQAPPKATYQQINTKEVDSIENNKVVKRKVEERADLPLPAQSSHIDVALDLAHRQKGLLWYSTYKVNFAGVYTFSNPTDKEQAVTFKLNFPASQAIYDDLVFTVDDVPVPITNEKSSTSGIARVASGKTATLRIGYHSQGLNEWRYSFGSNDVAQVQNFTLNMKTNFKDIDFPDNTISPSTKQETAGGWDLTWSYKNLLSGYQIAMVMPEKLQPGPLAGKISFFAPVSLFFFFFIMFIITTMRGIELHPMNYFFLAAAFFSFHLLLAYMVDHTSIHTAFAVSSVVSIFLVVSYLRLVIGMQFASREAAVAQFVYLVLFSYAFFLKGFTGLAITIGSVVTLFVVMQVTARIHWAEKFDVKATPEPVSQTS
jgi:inner membrane protein involved in colicin E2 resistance